MVVLPVSGAKVEPPIEMSEAEATIWRAVISSEPREFFRVDAQLGMLAAYCRHRAAADKIGRVVGEFEDEWLKSSDGVARYSKLLAMHDKEVRAGTSLATKLRLTNQSRYDEHSAAMVTNRHAPQKPWDM